VSRRPLLASQARLSEVDGYLQNVLSGRLPVNHRIIYQLQDVFNLLPNLNVQELVQAFAIKTNDMCAPAPVDAAMQPPPVSPEHRWPHALLLFLVAFPAWLRSHLGVRCTALLHGPAFSARPRRRHAPGLWPSTSRR